MTRRKEFERTPLLGEWGEAPLPKNPTVLLDGLAPTSSELSALSRHSVPDSSVESAPASRSALRQATGSLPPGAPEWMQAARALSRELEQLIARGMAGSLEQAAVARAWSAWALTGATRRHIWRVAHLVTRAHDAVRESRRDEQAFHDAASVLHSGLPSPYRRTVPFERALLVIRALDRQADRWAAVVDGTSELLGWQDWARLHAAHAIRAVIELGEPA